MDFSRLLHNDYGDQTPIPGTYQFIQVIKETHILGHLQVDGQ